MHTSRVQRVGRPAFSQITDRRTLLFLGKEYDNLRSESLHSSFEAKMANNLTSFRKIFQYFAVAVFNSSSSIVWFVVWRNKS